MNNLNVITITYDECVASFGFTEEKVFTHEDLLVGESFRAEIDEKIVFDQIGGSANAVWILLLAAGWFIVFIQLVNVGHNLFGVVNPFKSSAGCALLAYMVCIYNHCRNL